MGSGLDHPYLPEHRALMDRMVEAGGGSSPPSRLRPRPGNGTSPGATGCWRLVDGVLVTEARLRSGSLVTARLALDLGRSLGLPWAPEDPSAEVPTLC
jgi:DNA processing protein